jgi:hypothetical protein
MLAPALRAFSYLLPITLGADSFQNVMPRGTEADYGPVIALQRMGPVFSLAAWRASRYQFR